MIAGSVDGSIESQFALLSAIVIAAVASGPNPIERAKHAMARRRCPITNCYSFAALRHRVRMRARTRVAYTRARLRPSATTQPAPVSLNTLSRPSHDHLYISISKEAAWGWRSVSDPVSRSGSRPAYLPQSPSPCLSGLSPFHRGFFYTRPAQHSTRGGAERREGPRIRGATHTRPL